MSKVNTQELSALIQELQTLSSKPRLTPSEERRNAFLLAAISAVKAGASLAEIEAEGERAVWLEIMVRLLRREKRRDDEFARAKTVGDAESDHRVGDNAAAVRRIAQHTSI